MAERGHNGHRWRMIWRAVIYGPDFLVCGICYLPIDRRLRWPHNRSPSVDLIVPYSLGGDPHDLSNLQPAHVECNSRKGNRVTVKRSWIADDTP